MGTDSAKFRLIGCFAREFLIGLLVSLTLVGLAAPARAATPSVDELYQMVLSLQAENQDLKTKVAKLEQQQQATTAVVTASLKRQDEKIATVTSGAASYAYVPAPQAGGNLPGGAKLTAGVDLMALQMYGTQGTGGNSGAGNTDDYFPDLGYSATNRYWLQLQSAQGLGVRGRYFQWSDSADYLGVLREQSVKTADLEAIYAATLGELEVQPFAGLRWANVELDGSDFGERNPQDFTGLGITAGIDLSAPIGDLPFSLYGSGRYSLLYGTTTFQPVSSSQLDNTIMAGAELSAGIEYNHTFDNGFGLGARLGWEQQLYNTNAYLPYAIDPETLGDVGLGGPVFSLEGSF